MYFASLGLTLHTKALIMVECLLSDKGSLIIIRRPLMPFGNPESFPTGSDPMAKPTPT